MPTRKVLLTEQEIYHIFNKSIAEFKIFNNHSDFSRMINLIRYYQIEKPPVSFSDFIKTKQNSITDFCLDEKEKLVGIITYCIMPTHVHLILKQLRAKGISIFMGNVLNSYSKYFNIKHNRKGPLWEGRFKNILVKTDEQLLHLTRYLHLNPVTAYLVNKPEEWSASSYKEYLLKDASKDRICKYDDVLEIEPFSYKEFVEDRISYQRELAKIKDILIE